MFQFSWSIPPVHRSPCTAEEATSEETSGAGNIMCTLVVVVFYLPTWIKMRYNLFSESSTYLNQVDIYLASGVRCAIVLELSHFYLLNSLAYGRSPTLQ